ncbi:unnamed protein product, partial [marine sediment metagenome]
TTSEPLEKLFFLWGEEGSAREKLRISAAVVATKRRSSATVSAWAPETSMARTIEGFSPRLIITTPPLAGHGLFYRGAGSGYEILSKGGVAVLAAGDAGIRTVGLGDSLSFLGEYSQMSGCRRVYLFGSQVYVLTTSNMMYVVEIKDPKRPQKRTFLQFESAASGVDSEGEMLLAAEHERGVGIWWRCPCGPFKEQGRYSFGGQALDVKIRDKLAFVSANPPAMYVIDWSDSTNPEQVAS